MSEKVAVNPEMMVALLELSIIRGTQNDAIGVAIEWIQHAAKEFDRLVHKVDQLKALHAEIIEQLYGQGFDILGWHLNGNTEPLNNWFEANGWLDAETWSK